MAERTATIEETDEGEVRVTLQDDSGEMQTVRVTLPPESAYKLGEALCMKAMLIYQRKVIEEAEGALGDGE